MTCCATTFCQNDSTRYVDSIDENGGVNVLAVDPRLVLDVLFASSIGFLLFSRVNEQRTLWLLRGWLFLVAMAWFCLLYTSPSPRDQRGSRMPSSA